MHHFDAEVDVFAGQVFSFARARAALDGATLGHPRTRQELDAAAGPSVTEGGLGATEVLRRFAEVLEPACLSSDFPRYLAFVESLPKTPSERIHKDALSRSTEDCWDLERSGYKLRR